MRKITLYNTNKYHHISVSTHFIDNYLSDAPGEFVKVYLYLLRCMEDESMSLSVSGIADYLNHTEKDVLRALTYWEKKSLLTLDYDESQKLCGIHFQGEQTSSDTQPAAMPLDEQTSVVSVPDTRISKARIGELAEVPDVKQLLFIASQYLGKTLSPSDIEVLLHIYDDLGFSSELMEYLIETCVEKKCTSLSYIEDTAHQWYQNHITTVDQARGSVNASGQDSLLIMKALGISGRVLAQSELGYVQKWLHTYGFSLEIVLDACSRTIQAISRPSFRYADTILTNWKQQNVQTLADIQALDSRFNSEKSQVAITVDKPVKPITTTTVKSRSKKPSIKGASYPQRSYDFEALEQQLLNTSAN